MKRKRWTVLAVFAMVVALLPLSAVPAAAEDLTECEATYTHIYEIQGSGDASPLVGDTVWTEGVVTADFQESSELKGFFLQDAVGDNDVSTSDGVFVFTPPWDYPGHVSAGDTVRLQADVSEYTGYVDPSAFGTLTELTNVAQLVTCPASEEVDPVAVLFPLSEAEREAHEGMLLTFGEMTVADTYELHTNGEIVLSAGSDPLFFPTNRLAPGPAWFDDPVDSDGVPESVEPSLLVLDDASTHYKPLPVPYVDSSGTLRHGDLLPTLTGVLTYYTPYKYTQPGFKLEPTAVVTFSHTNPRPSDIPFVEGTIKVASFNLHNWWKTLGCEDCRGAENETEFAGQGAKLVAAITGLGADVVGVQELENNGDGEKSAIRALVDLLNASEGAGTWDFISDPEYPGGIESTNAIKVGIIYKPASVTPVGEAQWSFDPIFSDARPPLAQAFDSEGEVFTLMVNHFKSKGNFEEDAAGLNLDQGDGQGFFNHKRTLQAMAVLRFVMRLQQATGDPDILVIGDLNTYPKEDPVQKLASRLEDLTARLSPGDRYSFTFYGQAGQLDYGFGTPTMAAQVRGVGVWHIDAAEPRALNYYGPLFVDDQWRASDHDPIVIGVTLVPGGNEHFNLGVRNPHDMGQGDLHKNEHGADPAKRGKKLGLQ